MSHILSDKIGEITVSGDGKAAAKKKLRKACADFESIFLYYMLKTMRETVPQGGLFSGLKNNAYTACFDQKIAEDLSKKGGGIGIQKVLFNQLTKSIGD